MPQLLWDASALVKRYSVEVGSDTVDALFGSLPPLPMLTTHLGYVETCASQRRKQNQGTFNHVTFANSRSSLRAEVVVNPGFGLIAVDETTMMAGVWLIDQHNLNASDAVILAAFIDYAQSQPTSSPSCVVVASDQRLLRAAQLEGLHTLNPELLPAADVPAFLTGL